MSFIRSYLGSFVIRVLGFFTIDACKIEFTFYEKFCLTEALAEITEQYCFVLLLVIYLFVINFSVLNLSFPIGYISNRDYSNDL